MDSDNHSYRECKEMDLIHIPGGSLYYETSGVW